MREFYDQIFSQQNDCYSVVIEDDGKVAYAYLLKEEHIIGDVWLYNQAETPADPDWTDKESLPFLNGQEFVRDNITPILNVDEVRVEWTDDLEVGGVLLYIRDQFTAKLTINSKPGWSTNVTKDGPLARTISKDLETHY